MTWVSALAEWLDSIRADSLPPDVLRAGCRATLDTVACAFGALDHPAVQPVGEVVRALGGAPDCSLIGGELVPGQASRSTTLNAILLNGTLIRALDCNDIFFHHGVGGHPSDYLAVALAFAEAQHASGLEYLRSAVLGYELCYRLKQNVKPAPGTYNWDGVSISGVIAGAMAGLLLRLDPEQLANAMAIGGAQTFALSQVRGGEISMVKASADAVACQVGALGALLAQRGMTGPEELFEGSRGFLLAYGQTADAEVLQALTAPIERWRIHDVAVKPYPSIGTSQGAIAATLELVHQHHVQAADVEHVEVLYADLPITHSQIGDATRADPRTRETADHSFPFLVAVAIEDGEVGPAQFADERWRQPATRELMRRVSFAADRRLNAYTETGYPATVTIQTRSGATLRSDMLAVPGSPDNLLSDHELADKLRRFAPATLPPGHIEALERTILGLAELPDMAVLGPLLRGAALR